MGVIRVRAIDPFVRCDPIVVAQPMRRAGLSTWKDDKVRGDIDDDDFGPSSSLRGTLTRGYPS